MTERLEQRLIGTWDLVSYETVDAEGGRGRPYGDAVGRLDYDAAGHMSGQVMRPNRARVELGEGGAQQVRAAYTGYIAYFGTYDVEPDGRTVIHRVRGSLNPAWVGGEQRRAMHFDGDHLVLQADVTKGGTIVHHVLTWRRMG
ncbi:MAG TPA: lipocalin-like domain-containing protein [Vicinamibacterales bacterium]|nr:lipocalin-like domain-containing protein [Vicinamibacterales bacterium]